MAITNYNDKNNKNNITVIMKIIIVIMMIMTIKKLSLKNRRSNNTSHELLSDQWIVKRSRFYAS